VRLVGYLQQLFPNVRLVYLVRNGIEVVSSRMVFDGFKDRSFEWQCQVWAKAEEMARWGAEQKNFYLIRHESLLDPESASHVFTALSKWLDLKNDPRCSDALRTEIYHPTKFPAESQLVQSTCGRASPVGNSGLTNNAGSSQNIADRRWTILATKYLECEKLRKF